VEVIDNGCGIDRLDSIVQFFSSSSNLRKTQVPTHPQGHKGGKKKCERRSLTKIKGQYGVGLTTCLLYSQLNTHQPLR
jgi:DNA topoisomerase VI subunit B